MRRKFGCFVILQVLDFGGFCVLGLIVGGWILACAWCLFVRCCIRLMSWLLLRVFVVWLLCWVCWLVAFVWCCVRWVVVFWLAGCFVWVSLYCVVVYIGC